MKYFLFILSFFFASPLLAQTLQIEYGAISEEEIEMSSYENDPEAEAVILFDKGNTIFIDAAENQYDFRFTKHKRIKIFKNNDSELTEINIPYSSSQTIRSIEASTYNVVDGELNITKLNPSQIYTETNGEDGFIKKFVVPAVQDGAIFEYRFVIESPNLMHIPFWYFQDRIPTIQSEYVVNMIPWFEYVILMQGMKKFDYYKTENDPINRIWGSVADVYGQQVGNGAKFQDYIQTFGMLDIPAFENESYISSPQDYMVKVEFQLAKINSPAAGSKEIISTWPLLNKRLLQGDFFGSYIRGSARQSGKIIKEELNLKDLDENEKAKKIIEYVKTNFEWDGQNSIGSSQSPKNFLKTKTGNSADINLFLIGLLRAADIEAEPIILSTRDNGKIKTEYPFLSFTNYVIVKVNTQIPYLTDGTEILLPYNRIPTRCINDLGLIVNKEDKEQWIGLEAQFKSLEKNMLTLSLDPETLDLNTKISIQCTEYDSYYMRSFFKNDTSNIIEYYTDKIGSIERIKSINYDKKISSPYNLYMMGVFETEKIGDNIVLKPFLNLPIAENKLKEKERTYPIDFTYARNEEYLTILEIPENYSLPEFPEPFQEDNELINIHFKYTLTGKTLMIEGKYAFKKPIYQPSEYQKIKGYFDEIVTRFNEPIVLQLK